MLITCLPLMGVPSPGLAQPEHQPHVILLDSYPPFYDWKHGRAVGPIVEIVQKVFDRMGQEVQFRHTTWKRGLFDIQNGKATGLCAGIWTAERELFAVFTDEPLGEYENWVVIRTGVKPGLTCLEDLKGETVGVIEGHSYGEEFDSTTGMLKDVSLTENLLFRKLLAGRLDIAVGNKSGFNRIVGPKSSNSAFEYRFKINSTRMYLLISRKQPGARALARNFSETLRQMRREGAIAPLSP